jgi:hypothetical protein
VQIRRAYPPMIEMIDAAFSVRGKPILYAWGHTIYNPLGVEVGPELVAHEHVHAMRQGTDIEGWWRRYITEPAFRLEEEIPAHVAEFKELCVIHAPKWQGSRRGLRRMLAGHVASKLSAPLYGGLISFEQARRTILAEAPAI